MSIRALATRTFAALGNDAFRTLWIGTLFSFLGMQMQIIARGFLAYDLTGKNSALGLVMLSFGVPQLILSLWGGVIADRLAKRTILLIAQAIVAANSAWIAAMIGFGMIEFWMLVAAGVVQGAGFAFIGPARQAYIVDLVGQQQIANAVVLQQLNMNGTRVLGPALAGVFIAIPLVGLGGVYLMTTVGFFISSVTLLRLPSGSPSPTRVVRSPMADLAEGVRYVAHRPALSNLLGVSFLVVMLGFPYQTFLPSIAKDVYGVGAGGLGGLSSATAIGALAFTFGVAALGSDRRVWMIAPIMGVCFGLSLVGLGASQTFLQGCIVSVLVGGFSAGFQILNSSMTMMITAPQYNGRVQSMNMLSWSLFGIAALPLGILADHTGVRETIAVMGVISVVCVLAMEVVGRLQGAAADRALPGSPAPGTGVAAGR